MINLTNTDVLHMKYIPIALDDSVVETIDTIAQAQQRKRSALMRIWINEGIKKEAIIYENKQQSDSDGTGILPAD